MSSMRPTDDNSLSFDELRVTNVARCEGSYHPVGDWSLTDWMTCVIGEVGELAHEIKQIRRGNEVMKESLACELADVVIYVDLLAARLGIDLGKAVSAKFNDTSIKVRSQVFLRNTGRPFMGSGLYVDVNDKKEFT